MTLGLGTGSTVFFLVEAIARRVREEHLHITGVSTSSRTETQAKELGIPMIGIDDTDHIDLTIDAPMKSTAISRASRGAGPPTRWRRWSPRRVRKTSGLSTVANSSTRWAPSRCRPKSSPLVTRRSNGGWRPRDSTRFGAAMMRASWSQPITVTTSSIYTWAKSPTSPARPIFGRPDGNLGARTVLGYREQSRGGYRVGR